MSAGAGKRARVSRRDFLKAGAAGSASMVIGFYWGAPAQAGATADAAKDFEPNAYIEIHPSGEIRVIAARSEMGQGVRTSLTMILAEELDADWSKIKVEQAVATSEMKYGDMTTGGSESVRSSWDPLRKAGATARDMLVTAAAETWGVPASECSAIGGSVVEHKKSSRRLWYGALAEKAMALPVPKDVPLKDAKDYRIIGTVKPRVDGGAIVVGEAHYGIDTKVPGMLYAVVARPPVFGGRVKKFDAEKAQAVPGVKKVVEVPAVEMTPLFGEERPANSGHQHYLWGGVAVVADSTWQAIAGRKVLSIDWDPGAGAEESSENQRAACAEMVKRPGKELRKIGDPLKAFDGAAKKIEAEYELPFVAHTTMEPPNCTAHVRDGKCEVWAPTQNSGGMATALASALGIPASAITIHITLLGGGFGRRLNVDYGVEAALISKAADAPVKVIWTREDDVRHDFYRPMSHHRLRAGVDAQNQVTAWMQHIAAPTTDGVYVGGDLPDMGGTEVAGTGLPGGVVPNYLLETSFLHTRVPRGYWRGVDPTWNNFVVQSFIDEIAAATGKDPLDLRRELIATKAKPEAGSGDQPPVDVARLRHVLDLAAEKSGWGTPLPKGRGRGVAAIAGWGTYLTYVAEVTVANDGGIKVDRVVCAIDCGQTINPDMVKSQVEGGIVFGLTAALFDEITIAGGQTQQSNFNNYPMMRINDMPRVEIHIVPSHEPPGGCGEPPVPSIAPAVANAIFAATGKRLRRLPFQTGELVKA
ncbi:MAG TPA: xanthine dehydrogenase family protein molybdopterin-binding subunit [Candidatus Acidoferrales bacterium]|nr:xanthine dehydrogenase family protein molybdopterin-binding subunit [Candidatus Acidoferrales bacterium]